MCNLIYPTLAKILNIILGKHESVFGEFTKKTSVKQQVSAQKADKSKENKREKTQAQKKSNQTTYFHINQNLKENPLSLYDIFEKMSWKEKQ